VGREVEHPVADDDGREKNARGEASLSDHPVREREEDPPDGERRETVRVRVMDEVERVDCGRAGPDLHAFDSGQDEDRPDQIGPLCREEERAERDLRPRPLRGESDGIVSDEHGAKFYRADSPPGGP
jgi:hypothetical protein